MDQYTQPGAQYGAVRVYEMELYGYTGQLGANTNGLLKADAVGEYQINYTKAKESIASTAFTVEHDILSWEQTKEATCTEEGEMKRSAPTAAWRRPSPWQPWGISSARAR